MRKIKTGQIYKLDKHDPEHNFQYMKIVGIVGSKVYITFGKERFGLYTAEEIPYDGVKERFKGKVCFVFKKYKLDEEPMTICAEERKQKVKKVKRDFNRLLAVIQ